MCDHIARVPCVGSKWRRAGTWFGVAAGALALAVLMEWPFLNAPIERDSGFFMTAATEIIRGRVLYRDIWTNHPPGIYYANALEFACFGASLLTIRACNAVLIAAGTLVFFALARRFVGARGAVLWAVIFLVHVGGVANRDECDAIELYMILPAMLAVHFGLPLLRHPGGWRALVVGGMAGLALLFKQPGLSAGIAVAAAVAVFHWRGAERGRMRRSLFDLGMGCALVLAPVLLYLGAQGALRPAWEGVFGYNALYVSPVGMGRRLAIAGLGFVRAGSAVPLWFGALAMVLAVVAAVRRAGWNRTRIWQTASEGREWVLVGTWAILDMAAVCYPGFANPHYFIQIVPSWLLLGAGLVDWGIRRARGAGWRRCAPGAALMLGLAALLWPGAALQVRVARRVIRTRMSGVDAFEPSLNEAVAWSIEKNTLPGDSICVWGMEPVVHFLARRRPATRYFFTYPLQMPGYDNQRRIAEYVADLEASRPVLIVELSGASEYGLPLFGARQVEQRFSYDRFDPIRRYVKEHYVPLRIRLGTHWWMRADRASATTPKLHGVPGAATPADEP